MSRDLVVAGCAKRARLQRSDFRDGRIAISKGRNMIGNEALPFRAAPEDGAA
jgi:hypothetical protein